MCPEKRERSWCVWKEEGNNSVDTLSVLSLMVMQRCAFFCFLFLLSLSTCITVRMTDRKPKWAVMKEQEEAKQQQREEESNSNSPVPETVPCSMPSTPPPPPPPIIDFDSIPRRRGFKPVSGENWESLVHSRTSSAFFPPRRVHRFQQQ